MPNSLGHLPEFCPFMLTLCYSDKATEGRSNVELKTHLVFVSPSMDLLISIIFFNYKEGNVIIY